MCGRFRLSRNGKEVAEELRFEEEVEWSPRYNIAPSDQIPTVQQDASKPVRHFTLMRWGLIPFWTLLANSRLAIDNRKPRWVVWVASPEPNNGLPSIVQHSLETCYAYLVKFMKPKSHNRKQVNPNKGHQGDSGCGGLNLHEQEQMPDHKGKVTEHNQRGKKQQLRDEIDLFFFH